METLTDQEITRLNEGEPEAPPATPPEPPRFELAEADADQAAKIAEYESRIANLETQNRELQSRVEASPKPPAPQKLTVEQIEEAWRKGEISDLDRQRWIAKLEAESVIESREQEREERLTLQQVADELEEWKRLAPGLDRAGSETLNRISQAYWRLVKRGHTADIRTQLTAVESVLGTLDQARSRRGIEETTRQKAPVGHTFGTMGGGGQPPSQPSSRGSQLYDRLTDEAKQFYAGMGYDEAQTRKTLEFADEGTLRRHGRLRA